MIKMNKIKHSLKKRSQIIRQYWNCVWLEDATRCFIVPANTKCPRDVLRYSPPLTSLRDEGQVSYVIAIKSWLSLCYFISSNGQDTWRCCIVPANTKCPRDSLRYGPPLTSLRDEGQVNDVTSIKYSSDFYFAILYFPMVIWWRSLFERKKKSRKGILWDKLN